MVRAMSIPSSVSIVVIPVSPAMVPPAVMPGPLIASAVTAAAVVRTAITCKLQNGNITLFYASDPKSTSSSVNINDIQPSSFTSMALQLLLI